MGVRFDLTREEEPIGGLEIGRRIVGAECRILAGSTRLAFSS